MCSCVCASEYVLQKRKVLRLRVRVKGILKLSVLPTKSYNFCITNILFLFHRFENPFPD